MLKKMMVAIGGAVFAMAASVGAETVTVNGTSNIYKAPGASVGDGTDPTQITFTAGAGQVLSFDSITGAVSAWVGGPTVGADGGKLLLTGATDINGARGISGGIFDVQMFLVGVFLDSLNLPTTGNPGKTDFSTTAHSAVYAPSISQAFFIGDGLTDTGSGTRQKFIIPDTANMLVLGFLDTDRYDLNGFPGSYFNNGGSLTADYTITTVSAVPLPAAAWMLGAGLLGMVSIGRKKRASKEPAEALA